MITLYRNKRKGTLNQMKIGELYQCIDCLKLDKDQIKGTGVKGRILKVDLINFIKNYVGNNYDLQDRLFQISIMIPGTSQKYWIDQTNFSSYSPSCYIYIFKKNLNDEYHSFEEYRRRGSSMCNISYHYKSEKEFDKLIKSSIFLDKLYVKIKQICINYLLIDLVKYCILTYCDLLGDDLTRNIVII